MQEPCCLSATQAQSEVVYKQQKHLVFDLACERVEEPGDWGAGGGNQDGCSGNASFARSPLNWLKELRERKFS